VHAQSASTLQHEALRMRESIEFELTGPLDDESRFSTRDWIEVRRASCAEPLARAVVRARRPRANAA
jgi:hypothetical protein